MCIFSHRIANNLLTLDEIIRDALLLAKTPATHRYRETFFISMHPRLTFVINTHAHIHTHPYPHVCVCARVSTNARHRHASSATTIMSVLYTQTDGERERG